MKYYLCVNEAAGECKIIEASSIEELAKKKPWGFRVMERHPEAKASHFIARFQAEKALENYKKKTRKWVIFYDHEPDDGIYFLISANCRCDGVDAPYHRMDEFPYDDSGREQAEIELAKLIRN